MAHAGLEGFGDEAIDRVQLACASIEIVIRFQPWFENRDFRRF